MKIVIEIPEEEYSEILKMRPSYPDEVFCWIKAIQDGTPLPEHHGRLIDADALEKKMCDREEELGDDRALWESSAVSVALDMFAPTIIEGSDSE